MEKHVLITVPTVRSMVWCEHSQAVGELIQLFAKNGVDVSYTHASFADIGLCRDIIASRFLAHPKASHLLMIDDDIAFDPPDILSLLRANRPVASLLAPLRSVDWNWDRPTPSEVGLPRSQIVDFYTIPNHKQMLPAGTLQKTDFAAPAIMLIQRSALESMVNKGIAQRYQAKGFQAAGSAPEGLYNFFSHDPDNSADRILAEDSQFALRCKKANIAMSILHTYSVRHHGSWAYRLYPPPSQ